MRFDAKYRTDFVAIVEIERVWREVAEHACDELPKNKNHLRISNELYHIRLSVRPTTIFCRGMSRFRRVVVRFYIVHLRNDDEHTQMEIF